ncbi:hypothetical protein TIFTF001_007110 [Ficus carica]|uniref:Uncharacterized protein n=1 Tax=Ficus carica TaxID=3494 RepID=A0AA87ZSQ3_FICCA|nr:hypothetical protein TIFTF001_007110 [Ficus carica]
MCATLGTVAGDPSSLVSSPRPTDPENQRKIAISPENLTLPDSYLTLPATANHYATSPATTHQRNPQFPPGIQIHRPNPTDRLAASPMPDLLAVEPTVTIV